MEAKGLRVENLLILDNCKIVKLLWFKLDRCCIIEVGKEYPSAIVEIDRLKPIPLTEEWLLKFGFIQDKGMMCWRHEVDESIQIVFETLADFFRYYPRTNKIEYVHQLQNLYFALTGEELFIKE